MNRLSLLLASSCLLALGACERADSPQDTAAASASAATDVSDGGNGAGTPELGTFGIDRTTMDTSVDPGDDFNRYVNGAWSDSYELKPDERSYGAFIELRYRSEERVRTIIEELAAGDPEPGSLEQKVGDYYASFMDDDARARKGIAPISSDLERIEAIADWEDLVVEFGRAGRYESNAPIGAFIGIDRKDPDRYLANVAHGGLGLPDRDYYLEDTERFGAIREAYEENIAGVLAFTGLGEEKARQAAGDILALETAIAEHHWPRAQLRDRDLTYNLKTFDELVSEYPGYPWALHIEGSGLDPAEVQEINVYTPSAIAPLAELAKTTPLDTWKHYLAYHTVVNHAALLSPEIDDAVFDFYGRVLRGQQEQRARWKRAVNLVGDREGLGEALGRIYVERYFPPESKEKMDQLVANLRAALGERIEQLEWMGDDTRAEALAKLETFNPKIGYPDTWRDFDSVTIDRDDLVGNYRAVREYWYQNEIGRLGRRTDRDEWFMTPQTVNAYYNSAFNEIVFPAAILQPPFFDPWADPAVNYGAIGAVIGHEMGHGFDDQGSKSDAEGVQRNWWTDEDRARFEARTAALVKQYDGYSPLDGEYVNGSLTLGENIGDLGGLSMAYHAYHRSLDGREPPVIDGLTGDQRFFLAWAQVWRSKSREQAMLTRIKSDPHSPPEFRINGVVRNMDAWYDAFDVTEEDALYLPPEARVSIW